MYDFLQQIQKHRSAQIPIQTIGLKSGLYIQNDTFKCFILKIIGWYIFGKSYKINTKASGLC